MQMTDVAPIMMSQPEVMGRSSAGDRSSVGDRSLRLDGVTVRFGALAALDGVSLSIAAGERVGLVGPSGAGKTTLLRLFNGSVRPTAGRATVLGRDVASLSSGALRRLRSSIGFVHQDLSLVPNQRVIRNVLSGKLGQRGLAGSVRMMLFPTRAEAVAVHRILERVGVQEKLYERTDKLSGGQRQRVAIARALYQEPAALLADEPVASVDPARARDTVALLTSISREQGLTLCMSLHNLDLAREFFPRLVGMRRGRVLFDRPSAGLTDEQFAELYRLDQAEMLQDGAGAAKP
jgi:phosphonate transport system ATP-binding protein